MLRETPCELGHRLELIAGSEIVSSLEVYNLEMRIGGVRVRCGGVGAVHTSPEHRLKGYATRVMERAVHVMQREGYHLSALFGIADFYHRFGYASCLVECESTVSARDALDTQARFATREFRVSDAPVIASLCEAEQARRTGSIVRKPATWKGFRWSSHWSERVDAFVVVDGDVILGYAAYDPRPSHFVVGEVGYVGPVVFSTLLSRLAQMAVQRKEDQLRMFLPPDSLFLEYCHRYGCRTEITYSRDSDGMGRLLDQKGTLELLYPLLAHRLAAGGLGGWGGTLVVCTELGTDRLCFGEGGPTATLAVPQWMLAQVLLGYRSVADVLLESVYQAAPDVLAALNLMFPTGYPYIWAADRF